MSQETATVQPPPLPRKPVPTPKFKVGDVVRADMDTIHYIARVANVRFREIPKIADKCQWEYMLEGNAESRFPESSLSPVK